MPGKGLASAILDCHLLYVLTGHKNFLETGVKVEGTQCMAVQLNFTQRNEQDPLRMHLTLPRGITDCLSTSALYC